jgi:hypothetical protein
MSLTKSTIYNGFRLIKMGYKNVFQFPEGKPDIGSSTLSAYKRGPGPDKPGINNALSNPTLSTSQISLQSNVTTSLPILIRPWSQGWEKNFNAGSVLFVHRSNDDLRMSTAMDVPCFNFIMQSAQRRVGDMNQITSNPLYPKMSSIAAAGGLTNGNFPFGMFGVVRNDMLADSSLQKLYNCDVFGRTMMANIFAGHALKRGDMVSLALVKMDCSKEYSYFIQPEGTRMPNLVTEAEAVQVVGMCNGLICGHSSQPDITHPSGKNNVGGNNIVKEILKVIPLGLVSHAVARIPSCGQIKEALRNQDKFTLLPRIEVLLN